MTYDEYENFGIQSPDEFENEFDYFVDMENTADLKYDFDFDFPYGISAVDEDADVVAAWLPDDQYIFFETSVPEVLKYIRDNYSNDIDIDCDIELFNLFLDKGYISKFHKGPNDYCSEIIDLTESIQLIKKEVLNLLIQEY